MCPGEGSISSAIWSFATETWDASPTAIIRPLPVSFSGNVITPQVKVKNPGTGMIPQFNATMTISTIYASTKPVTNLLPGDSVIVYFDPWTAVLGNYNMKAWTSLEMDINHANDTIRGTVDVQPPAHNVGTMFITAPVDTINEGTVVTPQARVKNFGAYTESFTIRFKIGNDYNNTKTISNFASNAETTLSFPTWNAIRCNYLVSCSTECEGDQLPEDDKVSHLITVEYSDIELVSILVPRDTLTNCNDYVPAVIVKNNGVHTYPALCSVRVRILRYPVQMTSFCNVGPATQAVLLCEQWIVTTLAMGEIDTLFYPTFHPYWSDIYWNATPTRHLVQAEIKTSEDLNRQNNNAENQFIVKARANDLQMSWTGLLNKNMPVHYETIPTMTYNLASVVSNSSFGPTARFRVRINVIREIDNVVVYSRYLDRTLNAMSYACIAFSTGWTPTTQGWYKVKSWIEALPGIDIISENSTTEKRYYVASTVAKTENKSNQSQQNNSSNTPTTYKLTGNNPNPFSNFTEIQLQIPTATYVSVTIYDATGKVVKNLVNDNLNAGIYQRNWNRTDNNHKKVPAGIYFYEMKANNYTARRKMVITN
jgi:hypothetical protein